MMLYYQCIIIKQIPGNRKNAILQLIDRTAAGCHSVLINLRTYHLLLFVKSKDIIRLLRVLLNRTVKCRMSTDCKKHGLIRRIFYLPAALHTVPFKLIAQL